jgi:leader peptidase (prepilin peptidase)/N-methyltransferase
MIDALYIALTDTHELVTKTLDNPHSRIIVLAIFGALIGSLLNVIIYRLPVIMKERAIADAHDYFPKIVTEESALTVFKGTNLGGFSVAPCCDTPIKARHNIPVISWLWLKGKCAYCGKQISHQYISVEILTSCVFGIAALISPSKEVALCMAGLGALFIAISAIDFKHKEIPSELNLLVAVNMLLLTHTAGQSITDCIINTAFIYTTLCALNALCERMTDDVNLGGGDIKLLAALAIYVDSIAILTILLVSILVTTIASKIGKQQGERALGPQLCICTYSLLLFTI